MTPIADDREWFERETVSALPELYGTALRLAKNSADAEDLVAESIAKAWTRLASLHERSCFRAWLFRILTNTFISDCRARATQPPLDSLDVCDLDDEHFSLFERLHQPFLLWWGNTEQAFLDRILREDLERALDALPEAYRVAVVMGDLQNLSYQEIADTLGVPIGTVRSRLARGRALLQKALWKHGVDAGLTPPHHTSHVESQ
jgi:RNA polymerase sigma-70 factor (ECF subfamily)